MREVKKQRKHSVSEEDKAFMLELIRETGPGAGLCCFRVIPTEDGLQMDGSNVMSGEMCELLVQELLSLLAQMYGGKWEVLHRIVASSARLTPQPDPLSFPEGSA